MQLDDLEALFEAKKITSLHQDAIYILLEIYRAGLVWLDDFDDAQPLIDALHELQDL